MGSRRNTLGSVAWPFREASRKEGERKKKKLRFGVAPENVRGRFRTFRLLAFQGGKQTGGPTKADDCPSGVRQKKFGCVFLDFSPSGQNKWSECQVVEISGVSGQGKNPCQCSGKCQGDEVSNRQGAVKGKCQGNVRDAPGSTTETPHQTLTTRRAQERKTERATSSADRTRNKRNMLALSRVAQCQTQAPRNFGAICRLRVYCEVCSHLCASA